MLRSGRVLEIQKHFLVLRVERERAKQPLDNFGRGRGMQCACLQAACERERLEIAKSRVLRHELACPPESVGHFEQVFQVAALQPGSGQIVSPCLLPRSSSSPAGCRGRTRSRRADQWRSPAVPESRLVDCYSRDRPGQRIKRRFLATAARRIPSFRSTGMAGSMRAISAPDRYSSMESSEDKRATSHRSSTSASLDNPCFSMHSLRTADSGSREAASHRRLRRH